MKDLKTIKSLEKELKVVLKRFRLKDVGGNSPGFFLGSNGDVKGLSLVKLNLKEIPIQVYELTNLIQLNLGTNRLRRIDNKITQLNKLFKIGLYQNEFKQFPYILFSLSKLTNIYIQQNKIGSIDKKRLELCKLDQFDISKNPLNIPPEIIRRGGTEKLITYLNSISKDSKPFNEVKVILVGDGASGKTSLIKRLMSDEFDMSEPQTHGIRINSYVSKPNNYPANVKYNFWDFGGQEIMHATHQFFMSKRSIYVLVLNAREEPNPEYWLKSIESFGGDSPILIVINKIDENPSFDVNRNFLKDKYRSILGFYKLSCSTKEGISDFKSSLTNSVVDVPHISNIWSNKWFKIKDTLQNISVPYISFDNYVKTCKNEGIDNDSDQQILLEFLNDLGVVLHFKDFALNDTHVLDPIWVTSAVYRVINSELLSNQGGIISYSDLTTILKKGKEDKYSYPVSKFKYIIELMKKFQLCYEFETKKILVPDLLPVQEPDMNFLDGEKSTVDVEYDFLPKSILPRLIVNMHGDIKDNMRWRTGVVLYDEKYDATAVIKADYELKTISINVYGTNKRDYLSVILHFLRKINSYFEKLVAVEKVPLPDRPNIYVSLNHLYKLEGLGKSKYFPDGADFEYDVKDLLGSIGGPYDSEKELLILLEKVANKLDSHETLMQKANDIVQLQPNFFGMGVNLNAIIDKYLKKKKTAANKGYTQ